MPQHTPRRIWRRLLIGLAILLLVPVLGITVAVLTFDTNTLKPRIAAAVEAATGRQLALRGPISFTTSLVPTISIEDVGLANAPGGSAPEMLTARRVELRLALMPLLSREIDVRSLTLVEPRLLLEADGEGRPNWVFTPARRTEPPRADVAPTPPREPGPRLALGLRALALTGGSVVYRDAASGTAHTLLIERLETSAAGRGLAHEARITLDGTALRLRGETGTIAALMTAGAPWPLQLALETEGARLAIDGAVDPAGPGGWRGSLDATLDDTARLVAQLPRLAAFPPARDIRLRLEGHAAAGVAPVVDRLNLAVGRVALEQRLPGLVLQRLTVAAEGQDAPLSLAAEAVLGTAPLSLRGTAGTLAALQRAGFGASMPVDLTLTAGEAELRLQGQSGAPAEGTGQDLNASARIPDAAALGALIGLPAPALRDITANARITRPEPGRLALADLRATSQMGDVAGAVTVALGARLAIEGSLTSTQLDLTRLGAVPPPVVSAPSPALAPAAPAAPPAPPAAGARRVIPQAAINLDALRAADADLQLRFRTLVLAAELPLRDVTTHLVLREGRLLLNPIAATTAGGAVAGSIAADASVAPATMRIALRAEGLDLAALRPALGERLGNGRLDAELALDGAGADTRALAATLNGHVGLALVDGRIPPTLFAGVPPDLLRLLVPQGIPANGLPLRCFALRAPVASGAIRAETFLAESALGRIGATGTVNLGTEQIDLRLLPDLRTGIINLRAPVPVAGTLAAPRLGRVDAASAAAAGLNALLGAQRTPDRTLEGAAEALGGGAPALPDCTAALLAARGGRAGRAPSTPAPAPVAPQGEAPRAPNAVDILRGLLGGRR